MSDCLYLRLVSKTLIAIMFLSLTVLTAPALSDDIEKLAKESQNPVAPMATLPLKNNFYFGEGPHDRFAYTLDIQPVYPINIGNWNLISRLIAPIVYQPNLATKSDGRMGLGDINETVFLSPAKPAMFHGGAFLWGAGPMVTAPSSTNKALGQQKWCAGPSGVAVWMPGRWVLGALCYNQWSLPASTSGRTSTRRRFSIL